MVFDVSLFLPIIIINVSLLLMFLYWWILSAAPDWITMTELVLMLKCSYSLTGNTFSLSADYMDLY